MMKRAITTLFVAVALCGSTTPAAAETADGSKMQFNFTEDGKNFIRFLTWHQIWGRYTQMNPGTAVDGRALEHQLDPGIRRSRFLLFGRVADRLTLVFHFGINNQTFNNMRKPQLYVHDVWLDFDVVPGYLGVGGGLHYWNGISRMTNWSTIKFLSLDAPISNWPTIEITDQFARQMGVFFKGKVDKLDYRFALNRPFQTGSTDLSTFGEGLGYNPTNGSPALAGYMMYQFWDQEGNLLPYLVGTYIGTKRVFNIGAGFYYHPNQMRQRTAIEGQVFDAANPATFDEALHDGLVLSGDVFLDLPFGEKAENGAITAYLAYYYLDFGPDYVRNVGIMNIGRPDGSSALTLNGPGNGFPIIGTGHQVYMQAGYLLPFTLMGTKLQPYVTTQVSAFEGRDAIAVTPEVGANWFIHGHNAKLTLMYRARPIFALDDNGESTVDSYGSEAILQAQLFY